MRKCLGYPGHECPVEFDETGFNQFKRVRCDPCAAKWKTHQKAEWRKQNTIYSRCYKQRARIKSTSKLLSTGRFCRYCGLEILENVDQFGALVGVSYWRVCQSEECRNKMHVDTKSVNPDFWDFSGAGIQNSSLVSTYPGPYK